MCANVVVPSNPIQHWGHIPLSIVSLCLRDYLLCQKIPAFCVLMRTQWGVFRGRQPWVAQSFRKRKLDTESQLIGNGNIWRHSEWQKVETEHSNNSKLDQPHQIRGSQVTWLTSIVDCGSCSILIPKHVFLLLCYMYFFGSGNHTSLFLNWSNWIRFWGSRLTCLVSPGPLHLDIAANRCRPNPTDYF